MGSVVAIMNAKGGVGKSTTTMMLAEALTTQHRKRVLVVDTDPQANGSLMLLGPEKLEHTHHSERTLPRLITKTAAGDKPNIRDFLIEGASDLSTARDLHVLAGSVDLAWVERNTADEGDKTPIVAVAKMVRAVSEEYDFVFVDCPPSISYFTECWLRYCDWHLIPARPELLSSVGLRLVRELKARAAVGGRKLAREMGVLITLRRAQKYDEIWETKLRNDRSLSCFETVIPQSAVLQRAAEFDANGRLFSDKYGDFSGKVNAMVKEFLMRHSSLVEA